MAGPGDMALRILVLGGTRDGRKLAEALLTGGHEVISSLAGVTAEPEMPAGRVRIGGFGGVDGLANYLRMESIDVVADATHPFAAVMSQNAAEVAESVGVRIVRLERPAWQPTSEDQWISVSSTQDAVAKIEVGGCAFVTIGRKEISAFAIRSDIQLIARMIEAPEVELPADSRLILARPPFLLEEEIALMRAEGVTVLVSKNAGGPGRAKLDAARELGIPVIMIERPQLPVVQTVTTIEEFLELTGESE